MFAGICARLIRFRRHFDLIVFLLLLLILLGFASHEIIKFRPYSSVPFLTYKCITSVSGVYVLTAAGIAYMEKKQPRTAIFASIALCALLLWNSITRPLFRTYGISGGGPDRGRHTLREIGALSLACFKQAAGSARHALGLGTLQPPAPSTTLPPPITL